MWRGSSSSETLVVDVVMVKKKREDRDGLK